MAKEITQAEAQEIMAQAAERVREAMARANQEMGTDLTYAEDLADITWTGEFRIDEEGVAYEYECFGEKEFWYGKYDFRGRIY